MDDWELIPLIIIRIIQNQFFDYLISAVMFILLFLIAFMDQKL